jgi:cytochrome subunit of sulfide dehydrogenase
MSRRDNRPIDTAGWLPSNSLNPSALLAFSMGVAAGSGRKSPAKWAQLHFVQLVQPESGLGRGLPEKMTRKSPVITRQKETKWLPLHGRRRWLRANSIGNGGPMTARQVLIAAMAAYAGITPASAGEAPPGAASCSGCHAERPNANVSIQRLAGLDANAMVAAMQAYRGGQRPATVMGRIAKGFSDDEIKAIAAWFAMQR